MMRNENKAIIEAEFTVVQERTLEVIATEIRTIDNHVCQVALNGAIEIGQRLAEAKGKIGHGNWENWCRENLNYTPSWAAKLMKISTEYGSENSPYLAAISKTDTCADFSISKAFRLLQVPENEVEEFAREHDIDQLKVKELESEIKKLKEEKTATEEQEKALEELQQKLQETEAEKEATYILLQELQEAALKKNNGELPEEVKAEILERQKEIDKLTADLDKAKAKEKRLKEEKALAERAKEEAITEAVAKVTEESKVAAQAEAEVAAAEIISKLTEEAEAAAKRAETAESKLALSASEDIIFFKIKTTDLQDLVREIKGQIEKMSTTNAQQAEKMQGAFKKLMQTLAEGV